MMRLKRFFLVGLIIPVFLAASCEKDDGRDFDPIPERDKAEQALADEDSLQSFLETHFYNYEEFQNPPADFDFKFKFDTISGDNAEKIPLIDSPLLVEKIVNRDDVDYTIYILNLREGAGDQPTFADSTYVSYNGRLLTNQTFDSAITPIWFDLTQLIDGFTQGITEFRGSTGFVVNADNTITWNDDYGIGAIFMPSGLAYFSTPPSTSIIPRYSPLVFGFHLYGVNQTDHDHDGIPSYMEDIDSDEILTEDEDDDTDGDLIPDFLDIDDDGDGDITSEEIIVEEDGTVTYPDTDADGIVDYLDAE